ncbi:MAG: ParA family protein [Thermodesulfobacteriota bacterium]
MQPLYTWVDIEARLAVRRDKGEWPEGLVGASAYHDGLELRLRAETDRREVEQVLADCFGARYQPGLGIHLDSLPDRDRVFPVVMEVTGEAGPTASPVRPSFERIALLPAEPAAIDWPPAFPAGAPALFAFYSFKGGVGRTLHLLALLKALSAHEPRLSCLLVDADLEAPGITSLAAASGLGQQAISLADFLALAHADPDPGWPEAIALTGHHLRAQPLRLATAGGTAEHYFLPAFRDESQALGTAVRPEHLLQGPDARWRLGELFAALGQHLRADVVLLDLRAGLSELASPLLFDPRIQRVVVTTPSLQSLEGTSLVLRQLRKLAPPVDKEYLTDPVVLLSMVPQDLAGSPRMDAFREQWLGIYPDTPGEDEVSPPRLRVEETPFAQELLVISSLDDAMQKLEGNPVAKKCAALLEDWWLLRGDAQKMPPSPSVLSAEGRRRLVEFAESVEYAESGKGERFLTTTPLRNLAQKYREDLPVVVVMGAKGAGKTYTYLQLIRQKQWTRFLLATLGSGTNGAWGDVWPFLAPKSLGDGAKRLVKECQEATATALASVSPAWTQTEARDCLEEALAENRTEESWWRRRWLELFARSLQMAPNLEEDASLRVAAMLRQQKRRLVMVIDGLEEIFPGVTDNPVQQAAVRALLQAVPSHLRDIPNCPFGVVVFVRADVVRAAIPQNVGQFERLYEPYALRWDREQALRLAVWLCLQADMALDIAGGRDPESITLEEATALLWPVWGKKLGGDQSREARTADWVLAALADFRGQIQARDLVRLLRHAGQASLSLPLGDRLLPPATIRGAVRLCSQAKIEEIGQENPILVPIFDKLRQTPERKIPFSPEELGLDRREIGLLEMSGILLPSEGEYYMPEIFRQGLGFQLKQGKRPRVLSLAKRALSMRARP